MKRLTLILFAFLMGASCFAEVTIDKENCTITKDGKTLPLYGEVQIVESGSADLIVEVVSGGSCDLEVKVIESGSIFDCGEWKIIKSGSCNFTIKFVKSGSHDLTIKVIESGTSGFFI